MIAASFWLWPSLYVENQTSAVKVSPRWPGESGDRRANQTSVSGNRQFNR